MLLRRYITTNQINNTTSIIVDNYLPINYPENVYEKTNGVLIPYYIYPYDYTINDWNNYTKRFFEILSIVKIPAIIIVNPNNGPGDSIDDIYTQFIKRIISIGALPIGYVYTSYSQRPIDDIKADIDKWIQLYPDIKGIFFDEYQENNNVDEKLYINYAKNKNLKFITLNPGIPISYQKFTELQNLVDCFLVHENNVIDNNILQHEIFTSTTKEKKGCVINSQETINYNDLDKLSKLFKYIYITNVYHELPDYFESEMMYIERIKIHDLNKQFDKVNILSNNDKYIFDTYLENCKSYIAYLVMLTNLRYYNLNIKEISDINNNPIELYENTFMILKTGIQYTFKIDVTVNKVATKISISTYPIKDNIKIQYSFDNNTFNDIDPETIIDNTNQSNEIYVRLKNSLDKDDMIFGLITVYDIA